MVENKNVLLPQNYSSFECNYNRSQSMALLLTAYTNKTEKNRALVTNATLRHQHQLYRHHDAAVREK